MTAPDTTEQRIVAAITILSDSLDPDTNHVINGLCLALGLHSCKPDGNTLHHWTQAGKQRAQDLILDGMVDQLMADIAER